MTRMRHDARKTEIASSDAQPRIAFYAPLKPPDHAHPSGDRHIARLLWQALERTGAQVHLASRYRSRESNGDEARQRRIRSVGERLADRLIRRYRKLPPALRPTLWFTYHLYYKAPDWLGPRVSRALGIPYVVAEASFAPKRDKPPWQMVHRATGAAITSADAIVALNPDDVACVLPLLSDGDTRVHTIAPFLDLTPWPGESDAPDRPQRAALAARLDLDADVPWLVCVGMMRPGDKVASYQLLAAALEHLREHDWRLLVVGDGVAASDVEAALAPLCDRVRYLGKLDSRSVADTLVACDVYVWPAVNEAFGMAFLEAQACGLPVVAGNTRGVPAVVADERTGVLCPLDAVAIAAAIQRLLGDPKLRAQMGHEARLYVTSRHGLEAGAAMLSQILAPLSPASGVRR